MLQLVYLSPTSAERNFIISKALSPTTYLLYLANSFCDLFVCSRFGTWPVAMLAQSKNKAILEGPVCNGSQVIGWHTNEKSKRLRRFHVDMSGFAFNSTILWDSKRWKRPTSIPIRQLDTVKEGFQVWLISLWFLSSSAINLLYNALKFRCFSFLGDHIYRANCGGWKSNGRHACGLCNNNELASSFANSEAWISQRMAAPEEPWRCSPLEWLNSNLAILIPQLDRGIIFCFEMHF